MRFFRAKCILFLLVVTSFICQQQGLAQNEARVWNFGFNCGLNFSVTPAASFSTSAFSAMEGGASISNNNGSLLFYTDGATVYNRANVPMANGTGLLGNASTCQSAIIERMPGSTHLYYVFTLAELGNLDGLCYSIVDMNLAAGMGSITTKNQFVYASSCEKLASAQHCNGNDVWILTHEFGNSNFRAYLLTATGLQPNPVISNLGYGSIANGVETIGHLKLSPQGNRVACCFYKPLSPAPLQLYDFDASTGMLSNASTIYDAPWLYSCEFSPDGSKLYAGRVNCDTIFQFNLCAGTTLGISQSLYGFSTSSISVGAMQLAPNGKIYIARSGSSYLTVVNQPNLQGVACTINSIGQSIGNSGTQTLGLPNFNTRKFRSLPGSYSYSSACTSVSLSANNALAALPLTCLGGINVQPYCSWEFGDTQSASTSTAVGTVVQHNFPAIGTYTVKLLVHHPCYVDTVKQTVTLTDNGLLPLFVAGTTTICLGDKRIYTGVGATTYTWSTGVSSTSLALSPTTTSSYSLSGTSAGGCTGSKQFTINVSSCLGLSANQELALMVLESPLQDQLKLSINFSMHLCLVNSVGQIVLRQQLQSGSHALSLGELPAGYYTLYDEEGRIHPKKLIKPKQ